MTDELYATEQEPMPGETVSLSRRDLRESSAEALEATTDEAAE